jgi:hypothetical protein
VCSHWLLTTETTVITQRREHEAQETVAQIKFGWCFGYTGEAGLAHGEHARS